MENLSFVNQFSSTKLVFELCQKRDNPTQEQNLLSKKEDNITCSHKDSQDESLIVLKEKASNLFEKKDYKNAKELYKSILMKEVENTEIILKISLCHFYLKEFEEGIYEIQRAIALNPQDIDTYYYYLGCAQCDQKQYMKGIVYLEKSIASNSQNYESYFMIGNAYQNISCLSIAMSFYKKALEINPNLEKAYFQLGESCFKIQSFKEAQDYYKEACKRNPQNYFYFVRLGNSQWKNQNLVEAIESFDKATQLNKSFIQIGAIFQKMREALVNKNKIEICIEYFLKMFVLNPQKADSFYILGKMALQEKEIQIACDFFQVCVELDQSHFEAFKAYGQALFSLKEYKKAEQILQSALKLKPSNVDCIYDLGCCLFDQELIKDATEQFRKAFHLNSVSYEDIDDMMVKKGIHLMNSKQNNIYAVEYFNFAINLNNNNAEAYFQKARIYEGVCELTKAKELFEKAHQINPDNQNYVSKVELFNKIEKETKVIDCKQIFNEARICFNNKEYKKCIELLLKILSVSESYPKVNELLGYSYEQVDDYESAAKCYTKSIQQNPDDSTSIFNLGNCLYRCEKFDEAIEKFKEVINKNPSKSSAYENIGACYVEKKCVEQAIFYYKKALELNENDPLTNYGLGKVYYTNNQFEEALKYFQKTIDSDHENPNYYHKMANTITMLKGNSLVGSIFKKNLHYTTNEKSRMYSLMAGVLYEMKEYQKSLQKCEQAIELDPQNFNANLIKAASLKELTMYIQALNCFEEAIRINPNDADCYFSYGQALEEANLHLKALQKYDKSIILASLQNKNEQKSQTSQNSKSKINESSQLVDRSKINSNQKQFKDLRQFQAAQKCFEIVLVRFPGYTNYFNEIGNNLFENGDYLGAIECYKEELKHNQYDYAAYFNMGQCYRNIEKISEAIECFKRNIINKRRESCLQLSRVSKIDFQFVENLKLVNVSCLLDLQSLIRLELARKDHYNPNESLENQILFKLVSQVQQIVSQKAANYEEDILKLGQLNRVDDLSKVYKILLLTGLEEKSIVVSVKPELMLTLIGQQLIFFNNSGNLFYNPLKLFENILQPIKQHLMDVESFQKLGNGDPSSFNQKPIFPQQICFMKAIISQCLSKLKNLRNISLCMNFKIQSVYKIHFFQSIFRQKTFQPFQKVFKIENIFSNQQTNVSKISKVNDQNLEENIILKTLKTKNFDEAVNEYTFQNCITHRNIHSSYFFYWNEDENNATIPQSFKEKNLFALESLSYNEFLSVMLDCCEGLQQLTFFNIVHADIKPMNIFYDNSRAQIADFGSCIVSNTQNNEYTPTFCSPESESHESGQRITPSSDIYSLGKTFQFIAQKFKLPCSAQIQQMILMMMEKEPTKRIRVHDQIKIIQSEIFFEFLYQCKEGDMNNQRFCDEIQYIIDMRKKNSNMAELIIDIKLNHEKVIQLIQSNKLFIRSLFNRKYLYVFIVLMNQNNLNEQELQVKSKIEKLKEEFQQEAVEIETSAIKFLAQLNLKSPQEQYLDYLLLYNYEKFLQTIAFFDNINYEQSYLIAIYLIWKTNLFNIEFPENINNDLQNIDFMSLFKSFYKRNTQQYVNSVDRQQQVCKQLIEDLFNTTEVENQYKQKYIEILNSEQKKLSEKLNNIPNIYSVDLNDSSDEEIELESITSLSAAVSKIEFSREPSKYGTTNYDNVIEEEDSYQEMITQNSQFQTSLKRPSNNKIMNSQSYQVFLDIDENLSEHVQSLPTINFEDVKDFKYIPSQHSSEIDQTVKKGRQPITI